VACILPSTYPPPADFFYLSSCFFLPDSVLRGEDTAPSLSISSPYVFVWTLPRRRLRPPLPLFYERSPSFRDFCPLSPIDSFFFFSFPFSVCFIFSAQPPGGSAPPPDAMVLKVLAEANRLCSFPYENPSSFMVSPLSSAATLFFPYRHTFGTARADFRSALPALAPSRVLQALLPFGVNSNSMTFFRKQSR